MADVTPPVRSATTTTEYLLPQTTTAVGAGRPSGGDYDGWAIPAYVVSCETGGTFDWYAYNSSGASGPYQIMPGWFDGELAMNQSREAQHAMVRYLWNGGINTASGLGPQNWSACL